MQASADKNAALLCDQPSDVFGLFPEDLVSLAASDYCYEVSLFQR
jgi:hypothetical protein